MNNAERYAADVMQRPMHFWISADSGLPKRPFSVQTYASNNAWLMHCNVSSAYGEHVATLYAYREGFDRQATEQLAIMLCEARWPA